MERPAYYLPQDARVEFPICRQSVIQPHIYDNCVNVEPATHRTGCPERTSGHLQTTKMADLGDGYEAARDTRDNSLRSMKIVATLALVLTLLSLGLSAATLTFVYQLTEKYAIPPVPSNSSARVLPKQLNAETLNINESQTILKSMQEEITLLHSHISSFGKVLRNNFVRLAGDNLTTGRVEIKYRGEWGTICDDDWDIKDARVICRMLGFSNATLAPDRARYGRGIGKIWLDDVDCAGDELSIWHCAADPTGASDCSHSEDASAVCI